ncbi:hypothetical protein HA402_005534 [Bradysia odoriphaga]|nr:hypothetical protein HA402_005534 [Bradysia odoriphaga]
MIIKLISILVLIQTARSEPQFLTFENGKIGVNFGGYHAEAGLGGLLTGNAAHGGLSASAGTPYGQVAGAGLGGSLDGRTAGGLYAGASAGHGVGASAAIGGGLDANGMSVGGIGAESHTGSVSKKVVKVTGTQPESIKTVTYVDEKPPSVDATYNNGFSASSTFNAQSSINTGVNSQSSVASTYNAQSPLGSVDSQSTVHTNVETAPQQTVHVQKLKKRLHHRHHLWPNHNKVLTIEKRVQVPQYQTNTQSQTQTNVQTGWGQQPAAGFDFRKFFDFSFGANTGLGGFQQQQAHTGTVVQQQPQIVYEERVVPKVVYEKRIVPQVVVEKKIVPETVVVQKVVQPASATTTFTGEVQADKRVESGLNVHKEVNVVATPVQTQGSYAGSNSNIGFSGGVESGLNVHKEVSAVATPVQTQGSYGGNSNANFGFSGGYDHQAGSKFINDIFNIPIATLQAVNRLVSNKVASGGGNIDIQKTITVNHS